MTPRQAPLWIPLAFAACAGGPLVVLAPPSERVPIPLLAASTAQAAGIRVDSIKRFGSTLNIWIPDSDTVRPSPTWRQDHLQAMRYAFTHDATPTIATCIWLRPSLPKLDPSQMGPPTGLNHVSAGYFYDLSILALPEPRGAERFHLYLLPWSRRAPRGQCATEPVTITVIVAFLPYAARSSGV